MSYHYTLKGELTCDQPITPARWQIETVDPFGYSGLARLDHTGPYDKRGYWFLFPKQDADGLIRTITAANSEKSTALWGAVEELVSSFAKTPGSRDYPARTFSGRLTATGEEGNEFTIAVTDNHITQLYTTLHGEDADTFDYLKRMIRDDLKAARATGEELNLPKGARITIARSGDGLEVRLGQLPEDWAWQWRYTSAIDQGKEAFATHEMHRAWSVIERLVRHRFDPDPQDETALRVFTPQPPRRYPAN